MEQDDYVSLLDGRICFGTLNQLPPKIDILIDTRFKTETNFEIVIDHPNIKCFAIWPEHEPEDREGFTTIMVPIARSCIEGSSVYIFDQDGTGRSAMIAWYLLWKVTSHHKNDTLAMLNEEYKKAKVNTGSKWKNIIIPRFARQRSYMEYVMNESSWSSYIQQFRVRARGVAIDNRKRAISGKVRVGHIINQYVSNHYKDPRIEGYLTVRLIGEGKNDWKALSPDVLGPVYFDMIGITGNVDKEYSYTLTNLFYAISLYEDQVDKDGNITPDFYARQIEIAHTMKTMRRHPLSPQSGHLGKDPDFTVWGRNVLSFHDAKVFLFSHFYECFVLRTPQYQKLVDLKNAGQNLLIADYEGYDFKEHGMTYENYMHDPNASWGAAHVLYGMLINERPWRIKGLLMVE